MEVPFCRVIALAFTWLQVGAARDRVMRAPAGQPDELRAVPGGWGTEPYGFDLISSEKSKQN